MTADIELDVWREQWQSENVLPLDLRGRVERESLLMRIGLVVRILVTIVMGGGTAIWAIRSSESAVVLLAVATWVFLAVAWLFALAINRGNWSPSALDTAAFLDLSIRRCWSRLATIRFAAAFFVCDLMFCLGWVYCHSPEQRKTLAPWLFFSSISMDVVWLSTLIVLGFLIWHSRKKRAELAYLLKLREQEAETRTDVSNER
jgi:hypothetical protein